jgi:glycosyltransferase involved in cell wall biosynthesis
VKLAIVASHPVQYYGPLFRVLAAKVDLTVFYAHKATPEQQGAAGFDQAFDWDVDLVGGYAHAFLRNVAKAPSTNRFAGCDTPEIGARLDGARCDAVLVMGWHLKGYWQAILAAKHRGLPVLVRGDSQLETPRSPARRVLKALAYPALLRLFDAALYVGQRNRAYYRHYRMPEARLFFSPHGVDAERFRSGATELARTLVRRSLGAAPDDKLVMFAGKLVASKRPFDVLDAIARLRAHGERNLVALFVGSGPLEAELRARARSAQTPAHFLGFCNQSRMPAAMAAADVLVLPSDGRETWGLVCNEALACGVPIVVSDAVGCAADLAADDRVGRIFRLADVEALASALSATLAEPADKAAIARVCDRYSLEAAASGIVRAMFAVTQGPAKSRDARAVRSSA